MPTPIHSLRNLKLLPYNFFKANIVKLCPVKMTSFYRHSYCYKYHMCSHLKTTCTVTYHTINPTINRQLGFGNVLEMGLALLLTEG